MKDVDPISFAGKHRLHHRFSDRERDVHSPSAGFWFCWFGSLVDHNRKKRVMLASSLASMALYAAAPASSGSSPTTGRSSWPRSTPGSWSGISTAKRGLRLGPGTAT